MMFSFYKYSYMSIIPRKCLVPRSLINNDDEMTEMLCSVMSITVTLPSQAYLRVCLAEDGEKNKIGLTCLVGRSWRS